MNDLIRKPSLVTRRTFGRRAAAAAVGSLAAAPLVTSGDASAASGRPFLTPAEDFYTVARGNPKPHTLTGQALVDAGLTPESWRLEITADPFTEEPGIKESAKVESPLRLEDGTALDLPALEAMGKKHGVKYLKAMQCLNIAEPLGHGLWEGVPLAVVLRECRRLENVRRLYYRGYHNDDPEQIFQSSVSYTQAMETPPGELPVFLAYRLNGKPIPLIRGGPVRMVVPWAHGFKSIKWLRQLFLTNDYRVNDTYALRNNDPESYLKTSAYVDGGPDRFAAGEEVMVTGQVISGLSGFQRLEVFLRSGLAEGDRRWTDDDPKLEAADWQSLDLDPPPDWKSVLPTDTNPRDLLGFDAETGKPLAWPTRYGMAYWTARFAGLVPGRYELYARTVDGNGIAQPGPRPMRKAGKNGIQTHRFEVTG